MDINERIADDSSGKYAWLLMFTFLCGSLLTLVYLPDAGGTYGISMESGAFFASVLLALSAALSASVCGKLLMPVLFIALGVLTALGASSVYIEFTQGGTSCLRRLLVICLLVPLNFILGVWGMGISDRLNAALRGEAGLTERQRAQMYILMAVSLAIISLTALPLIRK